MVRGGGRDPEGRAFAASSGLRGIIDTGEATMNRSGLAVLFSAALCVFATGCPATVPYEAQVFTLSDLGTFDARRELEETIARARSPRILSAHVDEFSFAWYFQGVVRGRRERYQNYVKIYYRNVAKIDLYENNYVYLWGQSDQYLTKILFHTPEDARRFIDLIESLTARRTQGPPPDELYLPDSDTYHRPGDPGDERVDREDRDPYAPRRPADGPAPGDPFGDGGAPPPPSRDGAPPPPSDDGAPPPPGEGSGAYDEPPGK